MWQTVSAMRSVSATGISLSGAIDLNRMVEFVRAVATDGSNTVGAAPPPRPHAPAVTLETGDGEEAPALMLRSPLSRVPGTVALDTRCSRAIREPPSPSARFRGILRAAASSAARGRCRPPPDRRRHRTRWWSSTGASGERSNSRPPVGTQPGAIPRQDHREPGGPPLPRLTFTLSIIRHGFKCGCYLTDESEECTLS